MRAKPNAFKGIILIVLAMAVLPFIDVCAKFLGQQGMPVPQMVWARFFFGALFTLPLALRIAGVKAFKPINQAFNTARATFLVTGTAFFFLALKTLPIADTLAIYFVQPILITALSPIVLGEHVGMRRWTSVFIAFLGVMIIIRPGFQAFNVGTVFALAAGASSFTHLFNAMSQLTGREPGMVGAALVDQDSFIGIIADGFHVHDQSLKLALAATPHHRFMLVTDAMPPAAGGPDVFELQGRQVQRVNGRLQLADGTLAGSNLTMDEALRYSVQQLDVPLQEALQMASRNPARFLGRADLGVIKPGALASLVHLDDSLNVEQTWIEGK